MKRVWLKADACDLKVSLQHSVNGTWNGDEDLGDCKLQTLRKQYEARLSTLNSCLQAKDHTHQLVLLQEMTTSLEGDIAFLRSGLQESLKDYQVSSLEKGLINNYRALVSYLVL